MILPPIAPWEEKLMFDLDRFFADCQDAVSADASHKLVREVVARAVSEPGAVLAALGEPERAGINVIYPRTEPDGAERDLGTRHDDHAARPPDVGGDRHLYRARGQHLLATPAPDADREIEAAGARSLCRGDCTPLGPDIIHSVTNPIARLTGAIHVYGGDFLKQERSEWDPETLHERPYDVAKARQLFEESNSKRHQ